MVLVITANSVAETVSLAPEIIRGGEAVGSVFPVLDMQTGIEPDDAVSRTRGGGEPEISTGTGLVSDQRRLENVSRPIRRICLIFFYKLIHINSVNISILFHFSTFRASLSYILY